MTFVDVIAAIIVLVSVIGFLVSIYDSETKPNGSSNIGAVTFNSTIIAINVSFNNTSVQPNESVNIPFEVIKPPIN
jgi:hypothetical protein